MFKAHPLARIIHLLNSVPVNLGPIALEVGLRPNANNNSELVLTTNKEYQYNLALKISTYALSSSRGAVPETDCSVNSLISHFARSIVLPLHLLSKESIVSSNTLQISEMFQVPIAVVKARLTDSDVTRKLVDVESHR